MPAWEPSTPRSTPSRVAVARAGPGVMGRRRWVALRPRARGRSPCPGAPGRIRPVAAADPIHPRVDRHLRDPSRRARDRRARGARVHEHHAGSARAASASSTTSGWPSTTRPPTSPPATTRARSTVRTVCAGPADDRVHVATIELREGVRYQDSVRARADVRAPRRRGGTGRSGSARRWRSSPHGASGPPARSTSRSRPATRCGSTAIR